MATHILFPSLLPSSQVISTHQSTYPNITAAPYDLISTIVSTFASWSILSQLFIRPILRLFQVLQSQTVKDWLSLVLLGVLAESGRRGLNILWDKLRYELYIQSSHSLLEQSHDWLLYYWISHPSWVQKARDFEFEVKLRTGEARSMPWLSEHRRGDDQSKTKFSPSLMPKLGVAHWIKFNGYWIKFERARKETRPFDDDSEAITITIRTRSRKPLEDLILAAKSAFELRTATRLIVKTIDDDGGHKWKTACTRFRRPLDSVIIEDGVAELLLKDVKEFLAGQAWYLKRGVPWRRGYLLHGKPGTGKTSTIHALASELGLDVYLVTLSSKGLNDNKLLKAMTAVPSGSIIVMEDIDASTTKRNSKNEEPKRKPVPEDEESLPPKKATEESEADSAITLSGLLNAIDGIAGSEGRLLFMTTNHKEKLDPALIRPGRADLHFEYGHANKTMLSRLFTLFYPSKEDSITADPIKGQVSSEWDASEKPSGILDNSELDTLRWDKHEVEKWRALWVKYIPEGRFSIAQLQGLLMLHKTRPEDAVKAAPGWVAQQDALAAKEEWRRKEKEEADVLVHV